MQSVYDHADESSVMLAGAICMVAGYGLDWLGVCPVVKRIWTSSWVLWSGGLCFVWLAVLSLVSDVWGFTTWEVFLGSSEPTRLLLMSCRGRWRAGYRGRETPFRGGFFVCRRPFRRRRF